MMELLPLQEIGGMESCSLGNAAQSSWERGAGGKNCASPAGLASRWQQGRSNKGRAEPFGDEHNNIWRMLRLASFNESVY